MGSTLHCDLCLAPIAEGRTERLLQGKRLAFCCPGCVQVYEVLGPEEAARQGPRLKGGAAEELPPGPYLETWLKVEGLACSACAPLVEGLLQGRDGVVKAVVEPVSEVAQILYAPARVNAEELSAHLARYGFSAKERHAPDDEGRDLHGALRLVLAVVLGANAMMNAMVMYAAFAHDAGSWWSSLVFMERIYEPNPIPQDVRGIFTYVTGLSSLPVLLYCGWPILVTGWRRLRMGSPNMDSLVGFGAVAAFCVSAWSLLRLHSHHVYFDTASMLVSLLVIGRALEKGSRRKAQRAVHGLLQLASAGAEVLRKGTWIQVPAEEVRTGERVRVKHGERLPVDGRALEGEGWIDASSLTGEPRPLGVAPGVDLKAGMLLVQGTLEMEATEVGEGTLLARILKRVQQTLAARPPLQRLADRLSALFMPTVLSLALLAAFLAWARHYGPAEVLMAGVSVLVVACPCALGLATPLVLVQAVGECARRGLLLKGGDVLETAPRLRAIVFDKTGTLTTGKLEILHQQFAPSLKTARGFQGEETEVWGVTAVLEEASTHPLAEVLRREGVRRVREAGGVLPGVEGIKVHPGLGVSGVWKDQRVCIGRPSWLREQGVLAPEGWSGEGMAGSLVMLSVEDQAVALWALGDALRLEAKGALAALSRMGVQPWLLSGDRPEACLAVARELGLPEARVIAGALPHEKGAHLARIQAECGPTAMVGDGINDAVALSQADLGIAMGSGAGVALESAGLVLVHRDLRRIPTFLRLSRVAVRRIRQNLFWAVAYNALLIPLALAGRVHPVLAAFAMMASSLSVVFNGGRRIKLEGRLRDLEGQVVA